jgi:hypothetical protein
MPGYATVGSNRLNEALPFYDALLAVVGVTTLFEHSSGGRVYGTPGGTMFGVVGPYDGKAATVGNGSMFGFAAHSREDVDRFHAKALELGGTSEGAPGPRGPEGSNAYLAYVRDLEGNKLCAFNMG